MSVPNELRYTPSHEWIRLADDGLVTVGITDHAQEALGDIVFLDLPQPGRKVAAKEECAVVESVKAAADIYAPLTGEIVAVNQNAADQPESVNTNAYDAWLFKIKPNNITDYYQLLDANAYKNKLATQAH